jgi:hypothetical protein
MALSFGDVTHCLLVGCPVHTVIESNETRKRDIFTVLTIKSDKTETLLNFIQCKTAKNYAGADSMFCYARHSQNVRQKMRGNL